MKGEKKVDQLVLEKFLSYDLHVGGLKTFWCPQTKVYLSGVRKGFCVFDLEFLQFNLKQALKFLFLLITSKKRILFVGAPKGMEKKFSMLCQRFGHYFLASCEEGFFTNCVQNDSKGFFVKGRPSSVFFFDLYESDKVRNEILRFHLPILAFVNTGDRVEGIDYPIPANIKTWKGGLFVYNLVYWLFLLGSKKKKR